MQKAESPSLRQTTASLAVVPSQSGQAVGQAGQAAETGAEAIMLGIEQKAWEVLISSIKVPSRSRKRRAVSKMSPDALRKPLPKTDHGQLGMENDRRTLTMTPHLDPSHVEFTTTAREEGPTLVLSEEDRSEGPLAWADQVELTLGRPAGPVAYFESRSGGDDEAADTSGTLGGVDC